jgi:hypothetical protein
VTFQLDVYDPATLSSFTQASDSPLLHIVFENALAQTLLFDALPQTVDYLWTCATRHAQQFHTGE